LAIIAEAMGLDETGEYQERLMKKQAEVLGRPRFWGGSRFATSRSCSCWRIG